MKVSLVARNFTPVPTDICQLGQGVWSADAAHAGELSVQGVVEANGRRDRFDQAVGMGWMCLGLNADPAAALDAGQRAILADLGGQMVRIGSPAIGTDGQIEPAFQPDANLHDQPTTWRGARLPHAWLYARETGAELSRVLHAALAR